MFFMEISLRSQGQFQCWDKEQQRPCRGLCRVEGWWGVCLSALLWHFPLLVLPKSDKRACSGQSLLGAYLAEYSLALAGEHQHLPSAPILAPVGSLRWEVEEMEGK